MAIYWPTPGFNGEEEEEKERLNTYVWNAPDASFRAHNVQGPICRTPNSDHISPVLYTLHWLPFEQRIEYKLLLLAFEPVNNEGPSYLSDLLKFYIPSRQLRSSSDSCLLTIPLFRLKSFGKLKFSHQVSVLWNFLSISLRHSNSTSAFKSALKTHLFPSQ